MNDWTTIDADVNKYVQMIWNDARCWSIIDFGY